MSVIEEALQTALAKDLSPEVRAQLVERLAALDAPKWDDASLAATRAYNERFATFCTLAYREGKSLESLTALLRAAHDFAVATA